MAEEHLPQLETATDSDREVSSLCVERDGDYLFFLTWTEFRPDVKDLDLMFGHDPEPLHTALHISPPGE